MKPLDQITTLNKKNIGKVLQTARSFAEHAEEITPSVCTSVSWVDKLQVILKVSPPAGFVLQILLFDFLYDVDSTKEKYWRGAN